MPRWPKHKTRPGVDPYGRTPLWNEAFAGDILGVERELAAGADPNAGDDAGHTPLHVAVQEKHAQIVARLLRGGADPNRPDVHGNVPLWTAVQNWGGSDQILLLLLRSGADPRIENHYGRSPAAVLAGVRGEVGRLVSERFGPT